MKFTKTITYEHRLKDTDNLRDRFVSEVTRLETKPGPLHLQLLSVLAFEPGISDRFLTAIREHVKSGIIRELLHATWFTSEIECQLDKLRIARAGADKPGA